MSKFNVGDRVSYIRPVPEYIVKEVLSKSRYCIVADGHPGSYYVNECSLTLIKAALPERFSFQHGDKPLIYTATKQFKSGSFYSVKWTYEDGTPGLTRFSILSMEDNFASGIWKRFECNGFDEHGSPLHFTKEMLKPFMRVLTAKEGVWIAATDVQQISPGETILLKGGNWNPFLIDDAGYLDNSYKIIEIYDTPIYNCELLDPAVKGKLLWKRK